MKKSELRQIIRDIITEDAKKVWKYKGVYLVDSDFVNFCKGKLPNSELKHAGMGNFFLETPDGSIHFDRANGSLDGMSGRAHQVTDTSKDKKLFPLLMKKMKAKIVESKITEETSDERKEQVSFVKSIKQKLGKKLGMKLVVRMSGSKKSDPFVRVLSPAYGRGGPEFPNDFRVLVMKTLGWKALNWDNVNYGNVTNAGITLLYSQWVKVMDKMKL